MSVCFTFVDASDIMELLFFILYSLELKQTLYTNRFITLCTQQLGLGNWLVSNQSYQLK